MKAAVYERAGDPSVLSYKDVPDPIVGEDQVLIEVHAIAVEGGDLFYRREVTPSSADFIVGFSAAGVIVAKGSLVDRLQVGDRVATFDLAGAYAEKRVVPAHTAWKIPDTLDMIRACAIPVPYLTADLCMRAAEVEKTDTVLVQAGASMLGIACIQLAKRKGARVLCAISGKERASHLQACGADIVIDRSEEDIVTAIQEATGGSGATVVIDPVGGGSLTQSLASLRALGRLVFVGNASGLAMTADLWPAMRNNLRLAGVYLGGRLAETYVHTTAQTLFQEAAENKFEVIIDRKFTLSDAAKAHAYIEQHRILGRVILLP